MKKLFSLILVWILFSDCATSSVGREQFIIIDYSEINIMDAEAFKSKVTKERSLDVNNNVKCLTCWNLNETKDATGVQNREVVVIRDPVTNAFAIPGSKIGVYMSLLTITINRSWRE